MQSVQKTYTNGRFRARELYGVKNEMLVLSAVNYFAMMIYLLFVLYGNVVKLFMEMHVHLVKLWFMTS